MAMSLDAFPGGHEAVRRDLGDLLGPLFEVGITEQGKRSDLARMMTTGTPFEDQRRDVLIECDALGGRDGVVGEARTDRNGDEQCCGGIKASHGFNSLLTFLGWGIRRLGSADSRPVCRRESHSARRAG